ncbi:uncharacterized protein PG998_006418 [Apiospora kogelbergensis]|uniref:uncharacterized protein n=1 Tax=Apiospora kogelbergensis TaxID=1337665 RepID=UPI00312DDC2E
MRFINTTTFKFHEYSDSEVRNLGKGVLYPITSLDVENGDFVNLGGSSVFHINQFGLNISLPATPLTPLLRFYRVALRVGNGVGQYALFLHTCGDKGHARVSNRHGENFVVVGTMNDSESVDFRIPLVVMEPLIRIYLGFWLRNMSRNLGIYHFNKLERVCTLEQDYIKFVVDISIHIF